ncbi:MAG: peroxiredoxin [Labilithrix sp.]|nr:peroxiredoxin [Labilithrix sp.]MCW5810650.1 peroxiredoxin [Labilithrix sp.]
MKRIALASSCALLSALACTPKEETKVQPAASVSAVVPSEPPKKAGVDVGDPAPEVDMPLQDGRSLKLSSLQGKNVVVYFYPKDETPGCTVEAQNFRDKAEDLKKADITVIGVSTQDAASHKAFIEKEKLPFDLAIDADQSIAKAFGVPVRNNFHARWTFLVGKDGKIKKVWRDVSPKDHATEVLTAAGA